MPHEGPPQSTIEEVAPETPTVETKEQKENRVGLLLDELEELIEKTKRVSRDEPIGYRNARFGLMESNIREIKQLIKETKEAN